MAKPVKYRPLGVSISSLPSVNFVQTASAQARVGEVIASSLDRMAGFAFKKEEAAAKIEGQEYGAANAPSVADIIKAENKEERQNLLPGDKDTVYGRSARLAALNAVSANIEMYARDAITTISTQAAADYTDITKVQQKLDAVISGYSSAMADIDPASGAKMRLGLSSLGNTAYVAHTKLMATQAEKEAEYAAEKGMAQIVSNIGQQYINASNRSLDEMTNVLFLERSKLTKLADTISDKTALKSALDNFDKNIAAAKNDVISNYVLENPMQNSRELLDTLSGGANKITDPSVANIALSLDAGQRVEAFKAANAAISGFQAQESAAEADADRKRKIKVTELKSGLVEALISGNQDGAEDMIVTLRDLEPDEALKFSDAIFVKGGRDDADEIISLEQKAANGFLTEDDILKARADKKITVATLKTYFSRLNTQRDEQSKRAMKKVKAAFGIPEFAPIELNPSAKRQEALRIVAEAEVELGDKIAADPRMDRNKWALEFIKNGNIEKRLKDEMVAAKKIVNDIARDELSAVEKRDDYEALMVLSNGILSQRDTHITKHNELLDAIAIIKRNQEALGDE